MGEPEQFADMVRFWPTVGVRLLVAIVHTGGEVFATFHSTVTVAWLPDPPPLAATTE